jgi:hypothetical protein
MDATTINTKKWNCIPDEAQKLIRQQYNDYCKLVTEPELWWYWLKKRYDLEE